jgi:hypothetical protein
VRYIRVVGIIFLFLTISTRVLYAEEQEKKDTQEGKKDTQQEKKDTIQDLLDRIETLEKELQKLEDESKARKSLEVTPEEKTEQEKEVLEAVGREYTLSPKGTLSIDYSLTYSYQPTETFSTQTQVSSAALLLTANSEANHTITHSIYTSYSFLDNLTTSVSLPIVYRYDKLGTSSSLTQTDLGDISPGLAFQAPSSWKWLQLPGDISNSYSIGATLPTGRSPYKINSTTELSTGNGVYQLSLGSSFSKQIDPVVMFWSLGYIHSLPLKNMNYTVQELYTLEKVDTGDQYNLAMGMAYSLSYSTSLNMTFNYIYSKSTTLTYKEITTPQRTGDNVQAAFGVGMGITLTPKSSLAISVAYSLVNEGFSLTARLPFDFAM